MQSQGATAQPSLPLSKSYFYENACCEFLISIRIASVNAIPVEIDIPPWKLRIRIPIPLPPLVKRVPITSYISNLVRYPSPRLLFIATVQKWNAVVLHNHLKLLEAHSLYLCRAQRRESPKSRTGLGYFAARSRRVPLRLTICKAWNTVNEIQKNKAETFKKACTEGPSHNTCLIVRKHICDADRATVLCAPQSGMVQGAGCWV
jgi:hypothetical protein